MRAVRTARGGLSTIPGASALMRSRTNRTPQPQRSRDPGARAFALQRGATWAGDTTDAAPELLHAIIDTTPAWQPVVEGLANLRPGGRLVINAIRKEDRDKDHLLNLRYHEHLWLEKEIKSVANVTPSDITEFLRLAAAIPIHPKVETYRLEDANRALWELKHRSVRGTKVLVMPTADEG